MDEWIWGGSEYWTYLLPKRIGQQLALEIKEKCISLGTAKIVKPVPQ
ncbi:hypothetical protein RCG17_23010 [Neobacillus sp. PS3-12]|nr:hypothetical protein [Neobacillus sp. PS3-12]WML52228.1 hypothetical protein RCG17_23010 [Neobacillus sp. PS3-12]